jgi:hypothetical protein
MNADDQQLLAGDRRNPVEVAWEHPMSFDTAQADAATISSASTHTRASLLKRLILLGEWLLLLAAVAYIGGRALPKAWQRLNTDFPNYYVTARLLREGYSTNRVYEWIWIQRQKDRMGIGPADQPVVGFIPHTPFSALLMRPLTYWPPLAAKRIWIVCNLLLVAAVVSLLRSLTQLPWRGIALLTCLNFPLLRNLEYGQYYIVLLFLLTAALWLYVREKRFSAGMLIGVAAALKLFPALFLIYFLRKRDLRAGLGLMTGALVSVAASVWAFGPGLHRIYLTQVLPWALRGEANDPYNLRSGSLSSLLHRVLIYEPEWNPHPLTHAPAVFAVLHPLLQMLILVPVIYLITSRRDDWRQVEMEWSSFIVALLAISTLTAFYHFTLLLLPVSVMAAMFWQEGERLTLGLLLILYLGICFPKWPVAAAGGWRVFLSMPRLYLLLSLVVLCCVSLSRRRKEEGEHRTERWIWAAALCGVVVFQVATTLHHQRGVYESRAARLITSPEFDLSSEPLARADGQVAFITMRVDGYAEASLDSLGVHLRPNTADQLSHTAAAETSWIEEAGTRRQIVRSAPNEPASVELTNAENPVASPDGRWLAYLLTHSGKGELWIRPLQASHRADTQVTNANFDVEEMSFLPDGSLIFAASTADSPSALYMRTQDGSIHPLNVSDARYPAASPDGRWLVYSLLHRGAWNLWLQDLQSGATRRLTDADCNDIATTWQLDSKTIIYASDCGRALWSTELYRRNVVR